MILARRGPRADKALAHTSGRTASVVGNCCAWGSGRPNRLEIWSAVNPARSAGRLTPPRISFACNSSGRDDATRKDMFMEWCLMTLTRMPGRFGARFLRRQRACPHHVAAAARAARDSGHSMIEADRQELEANLKLLTLQIREKEVGRVAPVLRGRARAR
jgi:hypothetical protein